MVLSSVQRFGTIGAVLSGSSVRKAVHLAELLQERLVRVDALRQRNLGRADVRGEGEHFRQRDVAADRMGVVNGELAELQRAAPVIERVRLALPKSSAIASVSALKVEPIRNTRWSGG